MSTVGTQITTLSTRTISERARLQHGMDDFTSFSWGGVDMWQNFGAFIINEKKGSLKMYNGASYTNNYTKQQFMDGYTNLSGVTFDTQKISFKIGVYWISIEDYRLMMNLLHPYEINDLAFGFDQNYCYQCKLEPIKDSTRHILGREQIASGDPGNDYSRLESSDQEGYRYYTELDLTFDVIGPACAVSREIYRNNDFIYDSSSTDTVKILYANINQISRNSAYITSDLDYPIMVDISHVHIKDNAVLSASVTCLINGTTVEGPRELFSTSFKNVGNNQELSVTYNSEHGLLMLTTGDKTQIISLLTTLSSGSRIIKSLTVNRFFIPGRFNMPLPNGQPEYKLTLRLENVVNYNSNETTCLISSRTRTNVI